MAAMKERLPSIDALRGLVMIIMALDHVRDFIHHGAMSGASPTNLATTTPVLFMTRWITHFCAPVFMLTAGGGAYFYWKTSKRSKADVAGFLLTRGLWLIFLELTLMQFAYNFNLSTANPIFLLVLYVLGASMIVLAALIWLPLPLLAAFSIAVIALHNLADPVPSPSVLRLLLYQVGVFPFAGRMWITAYSLVPWFAVMALGFCLGPALSKAPADRQRFLMRTGIAMTITFIVIRVINSYGDPSRWSWQATAPDRLALSRVNPLIVFGRVPLFYFVLHFFAAHLSIVLLSFVHYGAAAASFMFQPVPSMGGPAQLFPPNFGYDLWVAYVVWIAIVAALYPVCRWYAGVKERSRSRWLSYL
jgi:uncharacterized membrane protein